MAIINGNENGNSRSPDKVICDKLKLIKIDKRAADSGEETNEILERSMQASRGYKICCLSKAEETYSIYQDILTCITLENYTKTETIKSKVEEYIKKDDAIEKLIGESSKLLKDLKVKMEEANNAACVMNNCIKSKLFPKSGKASAELVELENDLKDILGITKTLNEKAENAFESVVTIAGIQTFTNTLSLKKFSISLTESFKIFKDCMEANIETSGEDVSKFREELNKIIVELSVTSCAKYEQKTTAEGINTLIDFICEGECDEGCIDLCKEFDLCCDDDNQVDQKPRPEGKQTSNVN